MFSWGATSSQQQGNRRRPASAIEGTIRPPEYSREQHLDSYLRNTTLQRSTRRVSADDSTYDTVFQTVKLNTLILRVHLPPLVHPNAPVRRPAMTLAGVKARHAWLDQRMQVVGYEPTESDEAWRNARILLGAAVHQVIQHFQLNPPDILEITDKGLLAIQPKQASATSSSSSNGHANGTFPTHPPQHEPHAHLTSGSTDAPPDYETLLATPTVVELPKVPATFPELDRLSRDDLDELLDDELAFLAFCNTLPFMKELHKKRHSFINENVKMAEDNLKHKDRLESLHGQVKELRQQLQAKVSKFDILKKQQDAICAPPNTLMVMKELNVLKRQAFEESEKLAEDWLDDGTHVEQFCDNFVKQRKVHHIRASKLELLKNNGGKDA